MVRETFYCPMSALSISISMCPPRASQHHPYVRWGQEGRGAGAGQALLRPQGGRPCGSGFQWRTGTLGRLQNSYFPVPARSTRGLPLIITMRTWWALPRLVPRHFSVSSQPMLSPQHGSSTSWCSDQCGCSNCLCRLSSGVPGPPAHLCSLGGQWFVLWCCCTEGSKKSHLIPVCLACFLLWGWERWLPSSSHIEPETGNHFHPFSAVPFGCPEISS